MKREVVRVEPLYSFLEDWKAPTSVVTRYGDTIYVSRLPPFDPDTGEIKLPAGRVVPISDSASMRRKWYDHGP